MALPEIVWITGLSVIVVSERRGAACCALLVVRGLVGQGKPFDRLRIGPAPTRMMIPCTRFEMTRHASSNADVSGVERTTPGYPL